MIAAAPTPVRCARVFTVAQTLAADRRAYFGTRHVTKTTQRRLGWMERCQTQTGKRHRIARFYHASRSAWLVRRQLASPDLGVVPGVPYSFATCVAFRESTDGQGSSNVYGIIAASGISGVGSMSVPEQKLAFSRLYAADGTAPWSSYDGC
jgi:hypothetical protein